MDIERLVNHWEEASDKNFDDMNRIYESGTYDWALYVGHLCLEKLFKALFIQNTKTKEVPMIHNLIKLARYCKIETNGMDDKLSEINTFNVEAKYQIEKKEFYSRCTKQYTEKQIKIIKEIRQWLKEKLIKPS